MSVDGDGDGDGDGSHEWLEPDGLGGFAMGTRSGIRTRRYHGLLLTAVTPPTGRTMLVNGYEAEVITAAGRYPLTSQRYAPDVVHPNGIAHLEAFTVDPWPRWRHRFPDGTEIQSELFVVRGASRVVLRFRCARAAGPVQLLLRPLCSGRDYHAVQRENSVYRFEVEVLGARARLQPYPDQPAIVWWSNGAYAHAPEWFRNFQYDEERRRGLEFIEDLASPGVLRFELDREPGVWILAAEVRVGEEESGLGLGLGLGLESESESESERAGSGEFAELVAAAERAAKSERARRDAFASPMLRAVDAYVVSRGRGSTLIAGYPWFTDWGRDTFIALRGLCLATGQLELARSILGEWAGAVSEGMLPNRFADRGETPEYNSVDASLWFVIAVHDLLRACELRRAELPAPERSQLIAACQSILEGYARGARHGIRQDRDGLLAAGEPGVQLTWMDAKVGDWVVTPRIGKPVEVQALWLNALAFGGTWSQRWRETFHRGRDAFEERFWNAERRALYDIVDVDHVPGAVDAALRPNQVFAIGGLPEPLLARERALQVIATVEAQLVTPLGLRSLARDEPGYAPRYAGGSTERDGAYHQGTVWPWLIGPFVEAYVRVHGATPAVREEARRRFLGPLLARMNVGFGHIAEVADGDPPHRTAGCPFQAWSLGEVLRLTLAVLADSAATNEARPGARAYSR